MRVSTLLMLLPAIAAAQEQVPLMDQVQGQVQGWLEKAKAFLPSQPAAPVAEQQAGEEAPAAASTPDNKAVAEKPVVPLTLANWESTLSASEEEGPQEWLVFITGGNKTCFGRCGVAEKAFNESVNLFAADATSPNLGYVNCEKEQILCSVWSAGAPCLWHFDIPVTAPGQPRPETPLHFKYLNATTVTPEKIYEVHAEKTYLNNPAYDGAFHPFDGFLAQNGLSLPVGYILYGFSVVPSWMFMIGVSFLSRTIMSRRASPAPRPQAGAQPAEAS
ncbi:hypothetical protein FQN54_000357 [Arachnomyces sp. PD_36]|nr:hypothetical protein FQN54_000357 [Arachnomyces sp. PD_36]